MKTQKATSILVKKVLTTKQLGQIRGGDQPIDSYPAPR